ncbi:patatin-like phospholipase family protein [Pseudomonas mosselii]|uniref:patatin-like phospholipase family protein n=1 Tax=Pseudomonas mosselii TaxID=78327 RepID=UPI0021A3E864|nr:patatin-like phospholipase family protein [Pseudomonas mosselii]MEA3236043.1 patatin-like phospholipase family protein [Pseudomonas mosselii]UWS64760.1 patatin-like phospholipase family protein [Pseudomonas mosselii]
MLQISEPHYKILTLGKSKLATIFIALLSGCTSIDDKPDLGRTDGEIPDPARYEERSATLRAAENCHLRSYRDKLSQNANGKTGPCTGKEITGYRPELGVSLSGGGMRSATFSIGVLAGLQKQGILNQIDIVSSVSGGSYANLWLIQQLYGLANYPNQNTSTDELFKSYYVYEAIRDNPGIEPMPRPKNADQTSRRFQTYIENNSYLITKSQDSDYGQFIDKTSYVSEMTARTALWIPSVPLNLIANGVFRWQVNLNPWESAYRQGIERTFGTYPTDWHSASKDPRPNYHELAGAAKRGEIPFFIVNTTAAYGGKFEWLRTSDFAGFNSDLASVVYEFTPLAYGNTAFGYCDYQDRKTREGYGVPCYPADAPKLAEAVMMSGAAVDALKLSNFPLGYVGLDAAADALNLSLGRYIPNPRVEPATRAWHKALPFPFYLAANQKYDETRDSVYLSDGGHSENLGMYALVKRRVKNIIAIDAEHEATSAGDKRMAVFDALQRLRCHLGKEERLKFYKVVGTTTIPDKFLDSNACETFSRKDIGFDFVNTNPFFRFDICPNEGCTPENRIRVLYVKLSTNYAAMPPNPQWSARLTGCDGDSDFSCEAVWLYMQGLSACKYDWFGECDRFPQVATKDINYPRTQVNGHRGLGYDIGRRVSLSDQGPVGRPFIPWNQIEKLSINQPGFN